MTIGFASLTVNARPLSWEPLNPAKQSDCPNWKNAKIIDGTYDAYIRVWAQHAKDHGGTILLLDKAGPGATFEIVIPDRPGPNGRNGRG